MDGALGKRRQVTDARMVIEMKVPLLDLKAQLATIEDELKAAVLEVIDSTRYIMGPKVEALEEAVAAYTDSQFAIGVSSGTDALLAALMVLDVGPGDIVVTAPYTFFATAGAIARLHAIPAFVDIGPDTYNMDPAALRAWFENETEKRDKVKAIIPVHLYGQCADMEPILEVAREFNVPVIEDAAQAIGAQYPSKEGLKKAGSMGAMGCFSFFPSKNLGGIGDGGMIVTDAPDLDEKLRCVRGQGIQPKYYHPVIGANFRLDTIQAAALLVKLKYLDTWHGMRRENAAYYDENLHAEGVKKPHITYQREHHIYNQYVVAVPERRDELREHLNRSDIGNEVYYFLALHQQACFAYLGYRKGDFPHSEYAAAHTVALPIYPELTTEMQDAVIESIEAFYA